MQIMFFSTMPESHNGLIRNKHKNFTFMNALFFVIRTVAEKAYWLLISGGLLSAQGTERLMYRP